MNYIIFLFLLKREKRNLLLLYYSIFVLQFLLVNIDTVYSKLAKYESQASILNNLLYMISLPNIQK